MTDGEAAKYKVLVDRLRGIYTLRVNDGCGPLNGSDTFTRTFEGLPPINEEAAKAIEHLTRLLTAVYSHVGNHTPPMMRHVLPPWLRDDIRDAIYGATVIDEVTND